MSTIAFLILLVSLMALSLIIDKLLTSHQKKLVSGRDQEALEDKFHLLTEHDFEISLDIFKLAFENLEKIFKVDARCIRLTDKFGLELGGRSKIFPLFDSMELEDFFEFVDDRAEVLKLNELNINCVEDYVRLEALIESKKG